MLAVDSKDLAVVESQGEDTRWRFIARALLHCPRSEGVSVAATCRERRSPIGSQDASIRLLEFPSERTVLIEWSSPTGCRYGEQTWMRATATAAGVCVLSGKPVIRGNPIFRPSCPKNSVGNALAMILATEIDEARRAMSVDEYT
ncbi:DUF3331 domain-containing protein [Paraburkholderia sp. PGU19]|uniref:DUF3331 domain-containing protein n=1 Tax=Paraburkholderia sp. PGU19 TaxID=2735434 RepID=UPI0015D9B1E9|nr:DUF3331 domain-containing protein [Paraburkholderia sp. PGU19]